MGAMFGFWKTFGFLVLTGVAGSVLARLEGFRALSNIEAALARGEMPGEAMLDAALIFVAGILLAIPGFLTDVFALILIVPFTRYWFKRWLWSRLDRMMRTAQYSRSEHRFLIK
jgi:UPF0716 protein FxsA